MIAHNGSVNTNRSAAVPDRFTEPSQSTSAKIRIPISTRTDAGAGVREARNDSTQAADNEVRTEEARQRREELREDVVAVSEDGDTVQVSEEGNEELIESRDGSVIAREENGANAQAAQTTRPEDDRQEIEAPEIAAPGGEARGIEARQNAPAEAEKEEAPEPPPPPEPPADAIKARAEADRIEAEAQAREQAREITSEALETQEVTKEATDAQLAAEEAQQDATERAAQQPSTFAGISNQQLEQMYRDGQISQYAYDSEIEAREAREEEMRAENEEFSTDTARLQEREREVTNAGNEIKKATGNEASDTLTAKQRLDAIEKVEKMRDGNTEKARREEEQGRLWDYQLLT